MSNVAAAARVERASPLEVFRVFLRLGLLLAFAVR